VSELSPELVIVAAVNWHTVMFYLIAAIACGFALIVTFSSNIVRMAMSLVGCLTATSGLLFLCGAYFVGAMQIMIYLGGTVVLLIFGVMLTAQQASLAMQTRSSDWVIGGGVGGALLVMMLTTFLAIPEWRTTDSSQHADEISKTIEEDSSGKIAAANKSEKARRRAMIQHDSGNPEVTGQIGMALVGYHFEDGDVGRPRTSYLFPFEIVSVHLLIVLIGAAYLARAKKRSMRVASNRGVD